MGRERLLEVGGLDDSMRWRSDWDCLVQLIFDGSRVGLVNEPPWHCRLTPGTLSSQRVGALGGELTTLEKAAVRDDLTPAERETLERSLTDIRRGEGPRIGSGTQVGGSTRRRAGPSDVRRHSAAAAQR